MNGAKIALLSRAFINDSDGARKTPAEPFFEMAKAAGAEVRVHDPRVDPATSPDAPPGLSRDLEGVLSGADAVVVLPVRGTAQDGAPRAPALEGRSEEDGELPRVAVVEVVGETICELEDVRVAEGGLVATEKRRMRHKRIWRRGWR